MSQQTSLPASSLPPSQPETALPSSSSSSSLPSSQPETVLPTSSSNQLLDLLTGAPKRMVSIPSANQPTSNEQVSDAFASPAKDVDAPFPNLEQMLVNSASQSQIAASFSSSSLSVQSTPSTIHRDVSGLMHQFMGGSGKKVTDHSSSASSSPVLPTVKAAQLPLSPPESVSSASDNQNDTMVGVNALSSSLKIHSPGTASRSSPLKTPFDFVSAFDVLDDKFPPSQSDVSVGAVTAAAAAVTTATATAATTAHSSTPEVSDLGHTQAKPENAKHSSEADPHSADPGAIDGYEAANQGLSNLIKKLSTSEASSPSRSSAGSINVVQAISKPLVLPQRPAELSAADKVHHASHHVAQLHAIGSSSFDDPKTSGLSILSPSRSSSSPRIATLNLASRQPAGSSSLYPAKVETTGIALLSSHLVFPCSVSQAGLLPASRLASLGSTVVCYALSKGKIRLINFETGARALVQTPAKVGIRSITGFSSTTDPASFYIVALTETAKDTGRGSVLVWNVSCGFVLQGVENQAVDLVFSLVGDETVQLADLFCFTSLAWLGGLPNLAITTADNRVLVVDVAHLQQTNSPESATELTITQALTTLNVANTLLNEPLSAFAASADGSLMATMTSSSLETGVWTVKFHGMGTSNKLQALLDADFKIKAPLDEPLVVSHLSFIGLPGSIRAMLVGFSSNSVLALYDLASKSWKHVWKFASPLSANDHYNLVVQDPQTGSIYIGNSLRASVFVIHFDFEKILPPQPAAVAGSQAHGSKLTEALSLVQRLQHGLLPWSIQPTFQINEFALLQPCTSIALVRRLPLSQHVNTVRLLATCPDGVNLIHLPVEQSQSALSDDDQVKVIEKTTGKVIDLTGEDTVQASSVEKQIGQSVARPPPSIFADEAAMEEELPKKSKKNKKNKKKQLLSSTIEQGDDKPPASNAAIDPTASVLSVPLSVSFDSVAALPSHSQVKSPRDETVVAASALDELRKALQNTETRLLSMVEKTLEAKSHANRARNGNKMVDTQLLARSISSELDGPVRRAVNASISTGLENNLPSILTEELERMLLLPHFKEHLSSSIVQNMVPAVQKIATEVVSKALAPQFEQVMRDMCVKVEKVIALKMVAVRKALVAEQSLSLKVTEASVQRLHQRIETVLETLNQQVPQQVKPKASGIDAVPVKAEQMPIVSSSGGGGSGASPAAVASQPAKVDEWIQDSLLPENYKKAKEILPKRVAVIGAGPVGCLAALAFAQRGCKVDIFESRPDPRTHEAIARSSQRSINLALSTRGITGLRSVALVGLGNRPGLVSAGQDLADVVLEEAVPMRARMIHTASHNGHKDVQVTEISQAYSTTGEYINSVDRGRLNNILLDHAVAHALIDVHFEHRVETADFDHDSRSGHGKQVVDRVKLSFDVGSGNCNSNTSATWYAGLVIGCDGAHSSVRSAMSTLVRMSYTHDYIDSGYVELSIPSRTVLDDSQRSRVDRAFGQEGAWLLDPNHLHIWPRREFMLIALPNQDGSFTCTLFAPFKVFSEHLGSRTSILGFFDKYFPDAVPLIGEDQLIDCLTSRRPSPLGSIKCKPYHYKDRSILLGDAAHAMVPFYGQGLNCGFEDVRVLMEKIDEVAVGNTSCDGDEESPLAQAFFNYTKQRNPDLLAICQLAQQNYVEMAHGVVSRGYLLRKSLDNLLMRLLPFGMWKSLYSMATFSNLGYAKVIETERKQQRIVRNTLTVVGVASVTTFCVGVYRFQGLLKPMIQRVSRVVS